MGLTRWLSGRLTAIRDEWMKGQGGRTVTDRFQGWERTAGTDAERSSLSDQDRYLSSDDVYAAVTLLAEAAATVPLETHDSSGPGGDLQVLLERGNHWHGGIGFWIRVYSLLWLTGEVFIVIDRDNPYSAAMPNALWPVPGNLITVLPGDDQTIVRGYLYRPPHAALAEGVFIAPEDVIPITLWNPHKPLRGLSPLSSLRLSLDGEYQAKMANFELFQNGAMIDGLISAPGIRDDQRQQFEDALQTKYVGGGNRHKIGVVAAEASLVPIRLTPRDAEFVELNRLTTQDVAKAYCIPPMFLGDMNDATYSNYETAHRALWEQGILPKVRMVTGALNVHLAPQFATDAEIAADLSEVEALRENDEMLARTFARLVAGGADPLWALRRLFGEDVPPSAVKPLTVTAAPAPPADDGEPVATPGQPAPPDKAVGWLDVKAEAQPQLRAARAALLPGAVRAVDRAFAEQWKVAARVLDDLDPRTDTGPKLLADLVDAKTAEQKDQATDDAAQAIFQAIAASDAMREQLETVMISGVEGAFKATGEVYGMAIEPARATHVTEQFVRETAARKVQWVNETTKGLIRDGIATAIENGEGLEGVRRRIQAAFRGSDEPGQENKYPDRVENIAQTELARAYNHGTLAQFIDNGIEWQVWRYSGKPTSRHADVDGQVVRVGADFDVHGHQAPYPAYEGLPIGEAAKCECIAMPRRTGPDSPPPVQAVD